MQELAAFADGERAALVHSPSWGRHRTRL